MANDSVKLSKNLLRMKVSEAACANKQEHLLAVFASFNSAAPFQTTFRNPP